MDQFQTPLDGLLISGSQTDLRFQSNILINGGLLFRSSQVTTMRMELRVTQRIQYSKKGEVNPTILSNQGSLKHHIKQFSLDSSSIASPLLQHISHCSSPYPKQHQIPLLHLSGPTQRTLHKVSLQS